MYHHKYRFEPQLTTHSCYGHWTLTRYCQIHQLKRIYDRHNANGGGGGAYCIDGVLRREFLASMRAYLANLARPIPSVTASVTKTVSGIHRSPTADSASIVAP